MLVTLLIEMKRKSYYVQIFFSDYQHINTILQFLYILTIFHIYSGAVNVNIRQPNIIAAGVHSI